MVTRRIGILGGGQLARMSALAAYRLGMEVIVFDNDAASPAAQTATRVILGNTNEQQQLLEFAKACDVITLENEFVNPDVLRFLKRSGVPVYPSAGTIACIQDKLVQKRTLLRAGLAVTDFAEVTAGSTFHSLTEQLGSPFVLKSRKLGYDGYGNRTIATEGDFAKAIAELRMRHSRLYAEQFCRFTKELAVLVARNRTGTVTYPVVETIQENHICKYVIAPAQVPRAAARRAAAMAAAALDAVKGQGLFGIEFFYTANGKVLINEMAPRPHNSGHYSIDACVTSQFENHIRAICGLPLGSTAMTAEATVMVNLLGTRQAAGYPANLAALLSDTTAHVHIYGKKEERKGRKMGHITVTGNSVPVLLKRAKTLNTKVNRG